MTSEAIIQTDFSGIDGLQIAANPVNQVHGLSTLIQTAYVPVLPWDVLSENGDLPAGEQRSLPQVIGLGGSGWVHRASMLAPQVHAGQRVLALTITGSAATQFSAPVPFYIFPVPDQVSLAAAATLVGGGDEAWQLLHQIPEDPAVRVLVAGASGGVGLYLLQLLMQRRQFPDVISSPRSQQWLQSRFPELQVYTSDGLPADAQYDVVVDLASQTQLLRQLEPHYSHGQLIVAGLPGYQPLDRTITAHFENGLVSPGVYRRLLGMLAKGVIQADIDSIYPYPQVQTAQKQLHAAPSRGRILLQFENDFDK
ncbi:MAG: hypothetical protein LKJ06_09570 [Schleiferilactobacillus harbinensis]|jgi:NADPH:quinone reductase-like Zn-dependent oxidoreductase|nr:hypothetical protein [Schleiferilactobacillus harbinensis]